ncbi:putative sporulation protein YunB [Clostridium sp. CAG:780]|jgi:sporulation protein yunB|nr:putative sporulation protein YunB [Clostridium sp. CAG:780]
MKEDKIYSRTRFCITNRVSKKEKNTKVFSVIFIIIVAIFTFYTIRKAINPIIDELCIDKAKNIATKISNEEATVVMDKYCYDDLITIIRDNDGNIKILKTNTKNINQIMSDIPVSMLDKFKQSENANISLYLGSILGTKIFSATGPKINIRIANVGNVDTKLKSEFISQGINQTLHRIYLELNCEVTILTPYDTIKQKIDNQVLIAESVIVGDVPYSYYNMNGNGETTIIPDIE